MLKEGTRVTGLYGGKYPYSGKIISINPLTESFYRKYIVKLDYPITVESRLLGEFTISDVIIVWENGLTTIISINN